MKQYSIEEAKTNFLEIIENLENNKDDYVVICRNGKPIVEISAYDDKSRKGLFGCAKGIFEVPDNFDELDIESLFEDI